MPVFKVEMDKKAIAAPHVNGGVDAVHVVAKDAAQAKALARGQSPDHDGPLGALWAAATVTDMSTLTGDMTGWKIKVAESTVLPNGVTVTGVAGDTLDGMGTKLAAALVAAGLATAAYNAGTHTLTVETSAANHGANTITVTVTPPTQFFSTTYSFAAADIVGTITHQGVAASNLTVVLNAGTFVVPAVVQAYRQ